jgi:hypothetical protein
MQQDQIEGWGAAMRRSCVGLLVLLAICSSMTAARAQQSNDCKARREFLQACLKAHSSAACNTDYAICLNHCRKK